MPSTRCTYKFLNKEQCPELVYGSFSHCILHLELPDEAEAEFETISHAKNIRTQKKIDCGDFNFEGAHLAKFSAEGKEINNANFFRATFGDYAEFNGATFVGDAWFIRATFGRAASFGEATFGGDAASGYVYFEVPSGSAKGPWTSLRFTNVGLSSILSSETFDLSVNV
jgi:uncharacterized protein YjbI with pentapeptide repeats